MKKLFLISALFCSTAVFAADFCTKNQAELQQGKQQLAQLSRNGASISSVDCRGDSLEYRIKIDIPADNATRQQIATMLQQVDMQQSLCAAAEVKEFAQQGLNKVVYTYTDQSGAVIANKTILVQQCK